MSEAEASTRSGFERRTDERRRYNRRSAPDPGSPPYFEVFERIAAALESIDRSLNRPQAAPPTRATRPRRAADS